MKAYEKGYPEYFVDGDGCTPAGLINSWCHIYFNERVARRDSLVVRVECAKGGVMDVHVDLIPILEEMGI